MSLIKVKTQSLRNSFACRAFYDCLGDTLSVGIKQKGKFHSYVEAEFFSLDLTKSGKLLNIDVWKPRSEWEIKKDIAPPDKYEKQNTIFLEYRLKTTPAEYFTDKQRNLLYIKLGDARISRFVSPANSLIFELTAENEIAGFWICDIEEDVDFKKEGAWRADVEAT